MIEPMTEEEYYIPPKQNVFDEIQRASIEIWRGYSDECGYSSGKINRIKDLGNVKDNAWYMVSMFDPSNQMKLIGSVSDETAIQIKRAMHITY